MIDCFEEKLRNANCYGSAQLPNAFIARRSMPHQTHAPAASTNEGFPKIEDILRRIQGEFLEMPGLRLTEAQAQRLWGLDAATCSALLDALISAKFLFRTRDGAFMRIEHAKPVKAHLPSRATGLSAA